MRAVIGIVAIVASLPGPRMAVAAAQGPPPAARSVTQVDHQELALRDGSRLYGRVEREDDLEVVFRTQAVVSASSGSVYLPTWLGVPIGAGELIMFPVVNFVYVF